MLRTAGVPQGASTNGLAEHHFVTGINLLGNCSGFRVRGSEFRVQSSEVQRFRGSGFRVQRFRVLGSGFRVLGLIKSLNPTTLNGER